MSTLERVTTTPLFRTVLLFVGFLASYVPLAAAPAKVNLFWRLPEMGTLLLVISAYTVLAVWTFASALRLSRPHKVRKGDPDDGLVEANPPTPLPGRRKTQNGAADHEARWWRWDELVRSRSERWRSLGVATLGYGLGLLAFIYRPQFEEAVRHYVLIDTTARLLLAALLFLGIIMGFFIVRNWSKDQNEFVNSLKAIFGGVFVSALLGQLPGITLLDAFAHYAIGFAASGGINLILYSSLTRRYAAQKDTPTRAVIDLLYGSDKAAVIDTYFQRRFDEDPSFARAKLVETLRKYREKIMIEYARKKSERRLSLKGYKFYQLLAIEREEDEATAGAATTAATAAGVSTPSSPAAPAAPTGGGTAAAAAAERDLLIKVREVEGDFTPEMFRMGITIRQGDNLIYIAAPGEYRKPFPYHGSVAGLALLVRQTIVMDRDKNKKFRTDTYKDGLSPISVEHARGLDEIDYLSYVSVPVASNLSNPEEVGLGIINVDTRLFAVPDSEESGLKVVERLEEKVFRAKTSKKNLNRWGANLYAQEADKVNAVKYLEEMRGVIVPILELYLKGLPGV
jgi:hypothetical protein